MVRKPRLHAPGGLYHVMRRGNGGKDIFSDDEDRYHLYLLIQQGLERYGHLVHGFLLHDEPHTLAIQVAENPLSWQGKKRVIDRRFIREDKIAGCWRMIDF
jgi:putative transposase